MEVKRNFIHPEVIQMFLTEEEEVLVLYAQFIKRFQNKKEKKLTSVELLLKDNEEDPISLGDYTEQDRKDRQEFRDNFAFQHDLD